MEHAFKLGDVVVLRTGAERGRFTLEVPEAFVVISRGSEDVEGEAKQTYSLHNERLVIDGIFEFQLISWADWKRDYTERGDAVILRDAIQVLVVRGEFELAAKIREVRDKPAAAN